MDLGNGTEVPEEYRGKFAVKGGDMVVKTNGTLLYQKQTPCPQVTGTCERKLLLDNTTNVTIIDSNATGVCVTRLDVRIHAYFAEAAPEGTP